MPSIKKQSTLFATAIFSVFITAPAIAQTASPERVKEIAERGAHVMPFDLKQTQHIFSKTETGGVQQVLVRDPANTQQIELIRQHLTKISQAFSHGNFSGPAKIHGEAMPGLVELRAVKPGQLRVEYKELDNGAEITYTSEDQGVIASVHKWFDAQLADHGPDAIPGHPHGDMHKLHNMHDMSGMHEK
ncbi:aspartate carbamoyltransferase [Methylobacter sp. YRD-M1]|uniref:aspartate carbamoyltransferase n=1 Tax=Methylobacter sp. YRD-M1 TaxID=2911520 RepID=UPI00227B35AE|nr:aspartate carbamoyltransferase [Methylobacter sp. YRD-M1]WAK00268.1 aspartate carbamoyltransferase [Methylobacter sp. YRD-M1]